MRITLRELFLLVALVAMGCGWWVERGRASKARSDLETFLGRDDGRSYHFENLDSDTYIVRAISASPPIESPPDGVLYIP